ncbi:MAG: hypothetical protein K8L91_13545 [Anaerolineae bacterium]|nr:hypothetical protein [Anaerolineae bacterium]
MDERQILLDAKALITQKRYQEARRTLQPIAHNATAQKWLVKLDEIAPPPISPFVADDNPFADANDNPFWSPSPTVVEAAPSYSSSYAYMSEEEKFERVKVLLKDKNYEEARQILITLPDNSSAQKLLAKLQQIAPSLPSGSFGSPRQSNPPISDPFGRPASDPFGSSNSNAFGSSNDNYNPFAISPGNPGYEIVPTKPNDSLALLQSSSSRSISTPVGQPGRRSKNNRAVAKGTTGAVLGTGFLAWMGRRLRARIIGGAIALVVIGVTGALGIDLDNLFSGKTTFENDAIEMTYSGDWRSVGLSSRDDCSDIVGTCLLFLQSRSSATAVRLQDLALLQGNHQTTINVLWDGYQRANYGLHMVGPAASLKLDGQDAVQWYLTWRSPEGYDMYGMVLYLPTAYSVVEFSAWSNSQSIFSAQFGEVQELINSIQIKQPPR